MGSIIASIIGWLLGKLFGKAKDEQLERKYEDAKKQNLELRAKNAGLRVVREIETEERKVNEEWANTDKDGRYEILKRDFDDND